MSDTPRLQARRRLLVGLGAGLILAPAHALMAQALPRRFDSAAAEAALQALEAAHGGRLGVQVLDTGSGFGFGWRPRQRFALCSTFKLPLAAVVLRQHAAGRLDGDALLPLDPAHRVAYAPVLEAAQAAGRTAMSALELAHATQTTSDNWAANLLLARLGGPEGFTAQLRLLGDAVTRIDRWETEMNRVEPGDPRDTSTPQAMAALTAALFGEDLLPPWARRTLAHWLVETRTGLRRIRAGLTPDWRAGDRTGTALIPGLPNRHNDVAIAWPPGRPPLVIAAYWEADGHHPQMRAQDDAVLAEVGRIAAAWLSG